ncbi:MAG TPA: protein-methionine-sulfoxide reductase heme-binding subunit MsrQ [Anaeromyxobacteraceae bacterium]|nr:protein-methionine-sulfoxide reductase heme-binding subunit MsrQ [Anaeromyxobacteraceae bacterium]
MNQKTRIRLLEAATFALALVPLGKVAWDHWTGALGANPIEAVLNRLGFWTLTFLTLSLVPTPAHDLLGLAWPVRVRRMLGLFAFSYATLHLSWYVGVDQFFDLRVLAKDVVKRKFMVVGFSAWLLLVPLAVTSTDRWVRRLGYARWKRLHRLVYAAALLGVVHFVWRVKADLRRPAIFAAAVGGLLLARLVPWAAGRAARAGRRRPGPVPDAALTFGGGAEGPPGPPGGSGPGSSA